MNPLILLGIIAGLPVVLALVFRVSGVFLFLSAAVGSLFVSYVGDDASLALGMLVRGQNTTLVCQFGLLLVPVALSLLFLRKTLPKSKVLLHLPLLVATGASLAVLALPFFDSGAQARVFANQYGDMFKDAQDVVVATAGLLALAILWLTYHHKEDKHGKHK
jgi:hypothetical protein